MFGRRPQPHVFQMFLVGTPEIIEENIKIEIGFLIIIEGSGVASDLFMNAMIYSIPENNCNAAFKTLHPDIWVEEEAPVKQGLKPIKGLRIILDHPG